MWNTKTQPNLKLKYWCEGENRNVTWRADRCFIYLFLSVDLNHRSLLSFSPQMWHWGIPLFPLSLDGEQTQLLIYCQRVYEFEWWGWGGWKLTIMGIVICPSFVCVCKPLMSSTLSFSFCRSFCLFEEHAVSPILDSHACVNVLLADSSCMTGSSGLHVFADE